MLGLPPRDSELSRIRQVLAGLLVETKLIRLSRSLARKYSPDQPRAPAGQPDGGQWISEGSGAREGDVDPALVGPGRWASLASKDQAGEDGRSRERTLLEDGSEVLTIRIHAGPRAGDEEHTVTAPDGESRVFETSGDMQTIRDGSSGEILSRTRFTGTGVEPVASVQPAFLSFLRCRWSSRPRSNWQPSSPRFFRHAEAGLGLPSVSPPTGTRQTEAWKTLRWCG
ncbi:hypothetical protein [Methylobacterium segetis]|uniref:hypothetical protein n=1 Tax=Methylobacterium segetis TaxID=2488750 RepID=UPI0010464AD1|nr:hypothetical protein [Methylobacterium segetis]